jgi:hypothetical protein
MHNPSTRPPRLPHGAGKSVTETELFSVRTRSADRGAFHTVGAVSLHRRGDPQHRKTPLELPGDLQGFLLWVADLAFW